VIQRFKVFPMSFFKQSCPFKGMNLFLIQSVPNWIFISKVLQMEDDIVQSEKMVF